MLHGPLLRKIVAFALPLALTSIMQQLFNSADASAAGQFIGSNALAAIGATTPLVNLVVSLFVGLSVGANVIVAQQIALEDDQGIHDAVHTSMVLAVVSGVAIVVVGVLLARPLLELISTPAEVIDLATVYLQIYFVGTAFTTFYNFGSAILRSKGDTKRPLYVLIIACVLNIALNALFVLVFHWDVAGIAWATTISNGLAAVMVTIMLMHEEGSMQFKWRELSAKRRPLSIALKIGIPAGVQGVVFAISNVVIQVALNWLGSEAMAGSIAAQNYEIYTYFIVNAFAQAAVTFTSQNYAVGNPARCNRICRECLLLGVGGSFTVSMIFVLGGQFFLGLFTSDAAAIGYGMIRLLHAEAFALLPTVYEVPAGSMRGMGWSTLPAIITVLGTCVLRIAWVYTIFASSGTMETLMNVYPISWGVTGAVMVVAYFIVRKRAYSELTKQAA
ncbi:MAG: MATE family efflux transporter [Coriobacteriales bacterium]|jgi:putative MATE family efflux protein